MRCFFGEGDGGQEWGRGEALVVGGWCMAVVGTVEMLRQRINGEERFLQEMFGEDWTEYVERTKKLVPWVY